MDLNNNVWEAAPKDQIDGDRTYSDLGVEYDIDDDFDDYNEIKPKTQVIALNNNSNRQSIGVSGLLARSSNFISNNGLFYLDNVFLKSYFFSTFYRLNDTNDSFMARLQHFIQLKSYPSPAKALLRLRYDEPHPMAMANRLVAAHRTSSRLCIESSSDLDENDDDESLGYQSAASNSESVISNLSTITEASLEPDQKPASQSVVEKNRNSRSFRASMRRKSLLLRFLDFNFFIFL